jgi:hypothetical protein
MITTVVVTPHLPLGFIACRQVTCITTSQSFFHVSLGSVNSCSKSLLALGCLRKLRFNALAAPVRMVQCRFRRSTNDILALGAARRITKTIEIRLLDVDASH